jgi:hypothetical protein
MAHRRLTDAEALGRARDIAFCVKDVECNKEIEVDAVELGIVDVQEVLLEGQRRWYSALYRIAPEPSTASNSTKKARRKAGPGGAEL